MAEAKFGTSAASYSSKFLALLNMTVDLRLGLFWVKCVRYNKRGKLVLFSHRIVRSVVGSTACLWVISRRGGRVGRRLDGTKPDEREFFCALTSSRSSNTWNLNWKKSDRSKFMEGWDSTLLSYFDAWYRRITHPWMLKLEWAALPKSGLLVRIILIPKTNPTPTVSASRRSSIDDFSLRKK